MGATAFLGASVLAILVAAVQHIEASQEGDMDRLLQELMSRRNKSGNLSYLPSPSYPLPAGQTYPLPSGQIKNDPYNPSQMNDPYNPSQMNDPYNPSQMNDPYNPSQMNDPYNPSQMNNPSYNPRSQVMTKDNETMAVVNTPSGCVIGTHIIRHHHATVTLSENAVISAYFAFTGIPYAAPPVGKLRFKNPRMGGLTTTQCRVRNSVCNTCLHQQHHTKCVQKSSECWGWMDMGQEDCLHLNVYVPGYTIDVRHNLSVMVYIHGGGFMYGSADENGPDFFMERNSTILVTMNYRLGALGFLNLDTDDIPGNMGLKDQQAALHWVQRNIAAFGGDPTRVTLFGSSAGAASAHYHNIVPSSQGLFSRLILQSGTALAGFAYNELHFHYARQLAKELMSNASTVEDMTKLFQSATIDQLRHATDLMLKNPTNNLLALGYPPFGPSPERRVSDSEAKFLESDPEHLMLSRVHLHGKVLPMIVGITDGEGLFAYKFARFNEDPSRVMVFRHHPQHLIPNNAVPSELSWHALGINHDMHTKKQANMVRYGKMLRDYYKLGMESPENQFVQMLGDIFLVFPVHRLVNMTLAEHNQHNVPLYQYLFKEDGHYNWAKKCHKIIAPGAVHTDEVGYLMNVTMPTNLRLHQGLYQQTPSSETLQRLVTLWTDFANGKLLHIRHGWPEARGNCDTANYAVFANGEMKLGSMLGGNNMEIWERIFKDLRTDFFPVDQKPPLYRKTRGNKGPRRSDAA